MVRTKVPIDDEPNAVVVWPLPEVGDLRFVELIRRYSVALGDSGGVRLVWRPIDDPRRTDSSFEKLRPEGHEATEARAVTAYDQSVSERGGADHHLMLEYRTLTGMLKVTSRELPCLVVGARPQRGRDIVFHVPRKHLRSREAQNALGDFLVATFTAELVTSALNQDGYLTAQSMEEIRTILGEAERKLAAQDIGSGATVHVTGDTSSLIVIDANGESLVSKSELDARLSDPQAYDLIVDVARCEARCRSKRGLKTIHIRDRVVRILALVIRAQRPVSMKEVIKDHDKCALRAAYNSFSEGRHDVRSALPGSPQLFVTTRTAVRGESRFEFVPPPELRWLLICPQSLSNKL